MFNICIVSQFITINGILLSPSIVDLSFFFYYHTHIVVSRLALLSNDSLVVLKLCSLNHVATKLAYLELHIFGVSRILLITSFQGLLSPLLTNCWVNLWKMFWNWLFQSCAFFKKIHSMCKHRLVVVFHILLWKVYNLFQYYKTFFIYFGICPLPSCPFICFVNWSFPFYSPCLNFQQMLEGE